MWRLGFFFHEIAFGLLSVFIPLYLVAFKDTSVLGGPLVALGVMTSIAIFCSIPASFLWGYLCDATRHYKVFILLSFLSSAVILFLMTLPFAQNILLFVALYIVMQMLHVAHEAPKNVLIAEHYSRDDWEKSYGFYEGLTEIGFIVGLAIGLFAFASSLSLSVLSTYTLYLCSGLSVAAFVLSIVLIADPLMIFERRLVGIERKIDYTYRGVESSSRLMDGLRWDGSLKEDSFRGFALAIVLFALATSLFFTPLPIFLKLGLGLPTSMVYVAYILNSVGATAGYFLIRGRARSMDIRKQMPRFVLFRSLLIFMLVGFIQFAFSPTIMTGILLIFIGFAYAMYYIMMLSLSMELIPQGKTGFFDGLVGLGAAVGSFLGPFLATHLNYLPTFLIAAVVFFFAFITLKLFS
ncbi:MAG: MFS transporter [Candidatus Bathyarchaeia archaeon]|jgi:MFS family permease